MTKPRVIEFHPIPGVPMDYNQAMCAEAKVVVMTITEDEAKDINAWGHVWKTMLREEGVNMKFIVIPNGTYLPVPMSHYRP